MKLLVPVRKRRKPIQAPEENGVTLDGGDASTVNNFTYDNEHAELPTQRPNVFDFGGAQ
jgi:hypothetical protein